VSSEMPLTAFDTGKSRHVDIWHKGLKPTRVR